MDRRKFAKIAGAGTAGTILAAPAIAQSSPEIKWRWVSSFPKTFESSWPMFQAFSKRVSELTDGKFQIQLFGPGEIVAPLQVLDAVQNGTVEAGFTATFFYMGKDPTFAFGTSIPFGLNTRQMLSWMYAGGGLNLLNEFHANYGRAGAYSAVNGSSANQFTLAYNYKLSKRSKVYGYYTRVNNSAGADYNVTKSGDDFSSFAVGVRHNF